MNLVFQRWALDVARHIWVYTIRWIKLKIKQEIAILIKIKCSENQSLWLNTPLAKTMYQVESNYNFLDENTVILIWGYAIGWRYPLLAIHSPVEPHCSEWLCEDDMHSVPLVRHSELYKTVAASEECCCSWQTVLEQVAWRSGHFTGRRRRNSAIQGDESRP